MAAGQPKEIDIYRARCPEHVRGLLKGVCTTIRRAAPDVDEAIVYAMPTIVQSGNLVHLVKTYDQNI